MNDYEIKLIENGPINLKILDEKNYDKILFFKGRNIKLRKISLLCRCGKSSSQPFCDGKHRLVKFKSQNETKEESLQVYEKDDIKIVFNLSICAGAGNCVGSFPNIYKTDDKDWIKVDKGSIEELQNSVNACPSSALALFIKDKIYVKNFEKSKITFSKKSPLNLLGKFVINIDKWPKNANTSKVSLCRCGASKNKPFCDYSHASLKTGNYSF